MTVGEVVVVAHQIRGRVRLRLRSGHARRLLQAVEEALMEAPGVHGARVNEAAASVAVEFDPAQQSPRSLLERPLAEVTELATARARVDESAEIAAARERVWQALDGGQLSAARLPAVLRVDEAGPDRWRVTLDLLGQELSAQARLVEHVPPERLTMALEGDIAGTCTLSLSSVPTGTRLREQVSYELPRTLLARTMGRFAEPAVRRLVREHLAWVQRAVLEGGVS
jgi:carbon monoxide dehydrogenase subunit G